MAKKNISIVILEDLKKRIASGEFKIEERLPNERQLAEHYDSSRIPVREAIKELIEEGGVKTAPSVGTFVTGTVNPTMNFILDVLKLCRKPCRVISSGV